MRYISIIFVLVLSAAAGIQEYAPEIPVGHPAIQYFEQPVNDPVTRLIRAIETGKAKLEYRDDKLGYLPSLLESLGMNPDSQALVFSRTSFQARSISPSNPRAIYFGDDVAIGFVPGTTGLEIAATDPRQGVVFYTLKTEKSESPVFTRGQVCLTCHQGPATSGVPGVFIGSVFPGPSGDPSRTETAIITDHRTKFEDRWGGWYINAARGQQRDRANSVASNPADPETLDPVPQNVKEFFGRFDRGKYLTPVSDIVALMTFEHQTQMINYITRVGWEARVAAHEGKTEEQLTRRKLDAEVEAMLDYMLFVNEEPLKEAVEGVSTFTKTFPERGPRDKKGRSLRDFDLKTRLFRYPLSYVIYTEQFDALPETVRLQTYQRLHDVLTGKDESEKFARISASDRRAILEILIDTKQNLPAYWR